MADAGGRGRLIPPQCGPLIWLHFRPRSALFSGRIGGRRRDDTQPGEALERITETVAVIRRRLKNVGWR
jgi:hypothetical protein